MALWNLILQDKELKNRLRPRYKAPFPIEIRHAIAPWIEDQFRSNHHLDPTNPNDNDAIDEVVLKMASEIETMLAGGIVPTFEWEEISEQLQTFAKNIRSNYPDRKWLFGYIRDSLRIEYLGIEQAGQPLPNYTSIDELKSLLGNYQNVRVRQLSLSYNNWQSAEYDLPSNLRVPGPSTFEEVQINHKRLYIKTKEYEFLSEILVSIKELQILQGKMKFEIGRWKVETKRIYEGKDFYTTLTLKALKEFCQELAEFLWNLRTLVKNAQTLKLGMHERQLYSDPDYDSPNSMQFQLGQAREKIEELLKELVHFSFIVKIQPHQMLKSGTKFQTSAQLLLGPQAMVCPSVKITLMNESEACELEKEAAAVSYYNYSFVGLHENKLIQDDNAVMKKEIGYCASFKNSKVQDTFRRNVEKKVRKINRSVLDINYFIYYSAQYEYDGIVFNLGTFSYPVKVTTNGSQEFKSWETAIWDLAAGKLEPGENLGRRAPVSWENFAKALNIWFFRQTGRGLTDENVNFIVQTMLSEKFANEIKANPSECLSLERFSREHTPGLRVFTLWSWIFSIMKLITEHLRGEKRQGQPPYGIWDEGYILGMVSAESTHRLLHSYRHENKIGFALRFSPNALGTITIEWIENGNIYCTRTTRKDLGQRSLADRLLDITKWHILYSNKSPVSKSLVFEKYRVNRPNTTPRAPKVSASQHGSFVVQYVKTLLHTHVLDSNGPFPSTSTCSMTSMVTQCPWTPS